MSNKETNNEIQYSMSNSDHSHDDREYFWQDQRATTYYSTPNNSDNGRKKLVTWLCVILVIVYVAYSTGKKEGSESTPENKPYNDTVLTPVTKPYNGAILSGAQYYNESEITITADSSHDCVVSLKDHYGTEYVAFYVRAGCTVTVGVPSKWLYVYFASGKEWYGYGKGLMFGKSTDYSKDVGIKDFTQYTWQYTLYPVTDGNFSETPSNEDEFFS